MVTSIRIHRLDIGSGTSDLDKDVQWHVAKYMKLVGRGVSLLQTRTLLSSGNTERKY